MEITGRVTAEQRTAVMEDGQTVANFSIAVNEGGYKDKETGAYVEQVSFIECAYWLGDGENPQLNKGQKITVTGILGSRPWMEKSTGELRSSITMKVRSITLLKTEAQVTIKAY